MPSYQRLQAVPRLTDALDTPELRRGKMTFVEVSPATMALSLTGSESSLRPKDTPTAKLSLDEESERPAA